MESGPAYVVVDIWRAKPGMAAEVLEILTSAIPRFRSADGVSMVDVARLDGLDDQFMVVFRYRSRAARDEFMSSDDYRAFSNILQQLWDLESPIYRGESLGV
jgi:quinol monooxygenase YgiN